jgi:D-2-hydroxyacid dehydrogenase (NADP+)
MRVLVYLSNPVRAFAPTGEQLAVLSARVSRHELVVVDTEPDFFDALSLADGVVVWRFAEDWYGRAPRLRHVFTPAAGHEGFAPDPGARVERHFGRFHGAIMAESLLAMITFMNRRLGDAVGAQAERRWDRTPYSECRRLDAQVALIIGFGAIGQRCGRLLSAVGMRVHGLRRDAAQPYGVAHRVWSPEQRFEALSSADHVVCVLPGDTGTDHFLDAEAFSHMQPSACVYSLGRGNAIDPEALRGALAEGRIRGAFLDVVPEEPLPVDSPLWSAPNLYLTPHASAISAEYLDLYFDELAGQLSQLD